MKTTIAILSVIAGLLLTTYCVIYFSTHHRTVKMAAEEPPVWTSDQPAARGSVEWQLRSEKKTWVKDPGEITVGSYVQDTLEGRMNQPGGRGAIGKVTAVGSDKDGPPAATVDFGRGYVVGINLSELSLVNVVSK